MKQPTHNLLTGPRVTTFTNGKQKSDDHSEEVSQGLHDEQ